MLQNPCKTLGFKKNVVYKITSGGGEINYIQPVAYLFCVEALIYYSRSLLLFLFPAAFFLMF